MSLRSAGDLPPAPPPPTPGGGALSAPDAARARPADRRARLVSSLSWVALCLVLSGLLVYVYLAVIARALPTAEYGWFGAYWSLVLVVGFGAFLPVELELTRLVHLRPAGAPLPPGTASAVGGMTVLSLATVLAGWPLLSPALGGRTGLLAALVGVCLVSSAQFVLRGLLLGRGRVGAHGGVLLLDSALRVVGAVLVAVLVATPTASDFGWTLVAAIALAHLPLLVVLLVRARRHRAPVVETPGTRLRLRAVGHLLLASLAAQALLNAAPVLVTHAADPDEATVAAAFVASFTLVRLPLFVAVPLQSTLLPALTEVRASTGRGAQRRITLRVAALVAAAAAVAALVAALAGGPLVSLLFGARYALPGGDLAVLAAGSVLYIGVLLVTQALVASARHRDSAVTWIVALISSAVVFAVVPDLAARAALAFAVGSGVGLLAGTAALLVQRGNPAAVGSAVPTGGAR
ncbi:hypothetical protein [Geodermatophilus sp. SYSU D00815]